MAVKKEFNSPATGTAETLPAHYFGLKAIFIEPLLILGSSIFWLAVLPFAGLIWSAVVLWKLYGIHA